MVSAYVERRALPKDGMGALATDIANHLYSRQLDGAKAIVVAREPFTLMRMVRKRWLRLARLAQLERAKTLRADLILALTSQVGQMQTMPFAAQPPSEMPDAQVFFLKPEQLGDLLPTCNAVYVTCSISNQQLTNIEDCVIKEGLIVRYERMGSIND